LLSLPQLNQSLTAKSDVKKIKSPEIGVTKNGNVLESTYFDRNGYKIVAKVENGQFILSRCGAGWGNPETGESIVVSASDTRKLMDSLKVKHPETLIKSLGKRFALKEPHNSFVKIMTSLSGEASPSSANNSLFQITARTSPPCCGGTSTRRQGG
jgi:hypothetical protein